MIFLQAAKKSSEELLAAADSDMILFGQVFILLILVLLGVKALQTNSKFKIVPSFLIVIGLVIPPFVLLVNAGMELTASGNSVNQSASNGMSSYIRPAYFIIAIVYSVLRAIDNGKRGIKTGQVTADMAGNANVGQSKQSPIQSGNSGNMSRTKFKPAVKGLDPRFKDSTPVMVKCNHCKGRWMSTAKEVKAQQSCPECSKSVGFTVQAAE